MGPALPVIAIATTALGTLASARASQVSGEYQAAIARNNQTIANMNASYATQRGQVMEQQKRMQTAQQIGAIRAAGGASGVDINTGSASRVQQSAAKLGEFDAQVIRNAAAREAYGYKVQGLSYGAQATLDETMAQTSMQGGLLQAFGQTAGAGAQISGKWGFLQQPSVTLQD